MPFSHQLASVALLLVSTLSWAQLRPNVEELVDYETKSNAVSDRSNERVMIQHYEIPLSLLEAEISERLDEKSKQSLIFKKNGQDYVRWVVNPEDSKWHLELEKYLRSKGLDATKRTYFEGYMTASRSYIVKDPVNGVSFSIKVSTDKTGGNWRDKKQTWDDARQVKLAADYAMEMMRRRKPVNFDFMDEPVAFGVKEIDQGMILRQLADLTKSNKIYVPGFSALHEAEGRHIAMLNGSNNPAEFWKENYVKPLGRAIAELYAMTGLSYDSPHSQNFLVELDSNFKPTGKIVFRDLGDSYVTKEIPTILGQRELLQHWDRDNIKSRTAFIAQGVLHGNSKPSWVTEPIYNEYGRAFFVEFEKELSRLTRVPVQSLFADGSYSRSGDYFSKSYQLTRDGWQNFLQDLQKYGVVEGHRLCSKAFVF